MGNIANAIEVVVKRVLANLESLTVNRLVSRARHNLTIENGAGASIILTGEQVLINGLSGDGDNVFDIIYFGSDRKCWICRDSTSGDLVFHVNAGTGITFENSGGASYGNLVSANATYVMQSSPNEILYPSPYMQVSSIPEQESYIQFDISQFTIPVTSAILRLYSTRTGITQPTYFTFSRTVETFDQRSITWNNQPVYITRSYSEKTMENTGTAGWVEFDVTDFINDSNGIFFGLNIKRSSGQDATFYSASGTNPPVLVVV